MQSWVLDSYWSLTAPVSVRSMLALQHMESWHVPQYCLTWEGGKEKGRRKEKEEGREKGGGEVLLEKRRVDGWRQMMRGWHGEGDGLQNTSPKGIRVFKGIRDPLKKEQIKPAHFTSWCMLGPIHIIYYCQSFTLLAPKQDTSSCLETRNFLNSLCYTVMQKTVCEVTAPRKICFRITCSTFFEVPNIGLKKLEKLHHS